MSAVRRPPLRDLVTAVGLGALLLFVLGTFAQPGLVERAPNSAVASIAHGIRLELEHYALDHAGTYPPTAAAATKLLPLRHIWPSDSQRLEPGPWGGQQRALLPVCEHLGPAERPSHEGTVLGPGARVQDIQDCRHFGALLYDADPTGRRFVLYAIGKSGNQAVVRAVFRPAESRSHP